MTLHVLPGDALAEQFSAAGIPGDVIVFREALVTGPLDGDYPDEFWDVRSNFVAIEYGEDPLDYREKVAYEIEPMADVPAGDEVVLWFEYDLFCQVNMWFCHARLSGHEKVSRVAPVGLAPDDIWKGFAIHTPQELEKCFRQRVLLTEEDILTGTELWKAFVDRDSDRLKALGQFSSPAFPFLKEACGAAAVVDTEPLAVVRELREAGHTEFETLFPEFQKRAGVFGFGDLQVERLLQKLTDL